jgi:general secretion pathway protein B
MSFILDALKKSESDRQRNAGPGLHELRVAAPRARFPVWAVVIAALLGINLLVGIWWLIRSDTPTAQATAANPAQPAQTTPLPTPAPLPAAPSAADADMGRTDLERGIYNPADFEPAVEPAVEPAAPASSPRTRAAPPIARVPDLAPEPLPARTPVTSSLPAREDLVLDGIAVPEVSMSLHVFDPDPARRFAFINGSRVQEGDSLPNNLRVEAIAPEGVILSWQGRRFLAPLP